MIFSAVMSSRTRLCVYVHRQSQRMRSRDERLRAHMRLRNKKLFVSESQVAYSIGAWVQYEAMSNVHAVICCYSKNQRHNNFIFYPYMKIAIGSEHKINDGNWRLTLRTNGRSIAAGVAAIDL